MATKNVLVFWISAQLFLLSSQAYAQNAPSEQAGSREPAIIRAIRFSGNTVVSGEELRKILESRVGTPYDAAVVARDIRSIEKYYSARGYKLARVRDAEFLSDDTLQFTVMEGVIEKITVTGNRHTRSSVIREMIGLRPGMVYNENAAVRDRQRLDELGIFDQVVIEPIPGEEPGKVILNAKVRDGRHFYISGAAAYGGGAGLVGYLDVADTNFLGNAQSVRLQWQRGIRVGRDEQDELERRSAYELSFDDPRLLRNRLSVGFDLYHKETLFAPVFSTLDLSPRQFQFREGGTFRVGTALSEHTRLFLLYRHDFVHFRDLPLGLVPPREIADSDGIVGSMALRTVVDLRDRKLYPRQGLYALFQTELAATSFGGTFNFQKHIADVRSYTPIGNGTLEVRARGGIASDHTPLSEQFWMGGYDLLRGYEFDEFHGTRAVLISAEYQWPLIESILLAVFADEGYTWARDEPVRLRDLKFGAGFGLRFRTPIGSFRLDVAFGRKRAQTYLSLGQYF